MDGIDAALIQTDGEDILSPSRSLSIAYDAGIKERIAACMARARAAADVAGIIAASAELERELTLAHASAVEALLAKSGIKREDVGIIGFHGQTMLHRPARAFTWQMGDGALLANETGIDVASDFRANDIASGGEGAPLAPIYHLAIAGEAGLARPVVFVNIGGVSNLTWIGQSNAAADLIAFDAGPGNALIDDWCRARSGTDMDKDGALAQAGTADVAMVRTVLGQSYFLKKPPKSLDRNDIIVEISDEVSTEDGAATLTWLTAEAILAGARHFPEPPKSWVISGGGRRNPTLMAMLKSMLGAKVVPIEAIGFDGDALEAQLFGYLAVRTRRGLPITFPMTTGAPESLAGGEIVEV